MKGHKLNLLEMLNNNKFVFIFSLIIALIIWFFIALFFSPVEERVIKNVPVVINMENSVPSKLGLQIFGTSEFTVDITVSGKRYVISPATLSADDLIVTADTSYVDGAGKNQLQIAVAQSEVTASFDIVGYSENYIEVFFDHLLEKEYTLETDITSESGAVVADDYIRGDTLVSREIVNISGPATEVEKISSVKAKINISEPLTETTTYDATIIPLNEYGGTLRYLTINDGNENVTVTIPVLKAATLKNVVLFKNMPDCFGENQISYVCSPATMDVAMDADLLGGSNTLTVGSVDFSRVNIGKNTFEFPVSGIQSATVTDGTESVKVTFDISGFSKSTYTIPVERIKFINTTGDLSYKVDRVSPVTVTVIGLESELATITENDIYAEIDASLLDVESDKQSAQLSIVINNRTSCWAYGNYNVLITSK